jgi:SPASM domain peptide maturase of grasp-with-spasm system
MYFSIYSNCIPVQGLQRSMIYDIQRSKFDFIPNDLLVIIRKYNGQMISDIYEDYDVKEHVILDEYFEFLIERDYIMLYADQKKLEEFPNFDFQWDFPSTITNAILDFDSTRIDIQLYYSVLQQLEELGCYYLQIRFWRNFDVFVFYEKIFDFIEEFNFQSVQVVLPFTDSVPLEFYINIYESHPKVSEVTITHCTSKFTEEIESYKTQKFPKVINLHCMSDNVNDHTFCGVIDPVYFTINEPFFTESIEHNTCLNRKIGIDVNGEIKNCPSMDKSYGNIKDSNIKDILNIAEYRRFWFITKDQIDVCKVCEFRRMCPDCRVYAAGSYGKPSKCNYDPFTCTWKN